MDASNLTLDQLMVPKSQPVSYPRRNSTSAKRKREQDSFEKIIASQQLVAAKQMRQRTKPTTSLMPCVFEPSSPWVVLRLSTGYLGITGTGLRGTELSIAMRASGGDLWEKIVLYIQTCSQTQLLQLFRYFINPAMTRTSKVYHWSSRPTPSARNALCNALTVRAESQCPRHVNLHTKEIRTLLGQLKIFTRHRKPEAIPARLSNPTPDPVSSLPVGGWQLAAIARNHFTLRGPGFAETPIAQAVDVQEGRVWCALLRHLFTSTTLSLQETCGSLAIELAPSTWLPPLSNAKRFQVCRTVTAWARRQASQRDYNHDQLAILSAPHTDYPIARRELSEWRAQILSILDCPLKDLRTWLDIDQPDLIQMITCVQKFLDARKDGAQLCFQDISLYQLEGHPLKDRINQLRINLLHRHDTICHMNRVMARVRRAKTDLLAPYENHLLVARDRQGRDRAYSIYRRPVGERHLELTGIVTCPKTIDPWIRSSANVTTGYQAAFLEELMEESLARNRLSGIQATPISEDDQTTFCQHGLEDQEALSAPMILPPHRYLAWLQKYGGQI